MADKLRMSPLKPTSEWHSRNYLPHWEAGEAPQAITFRLSDSLPLEARSRFEAELRSLPEEAHMRERRLFIERTLDAGRGEAFLSRPEIGEIVEDALLFFDGERYRLHAWCVMPNHVHVLATPLAENALSALVHGWKSFTARKINAVLNRQGQVWFPEYYDRKIRTEQHFEAVRYYIEQTPVKAGLCARAQEWVFSSASRSR
jgi:putative transposase